LTLLTLLVASTLFPNESTVDKIAAFMIPWNHQVHHVTRSSLKTIHQVGNEIWLTNFSVPSGVVLDERSLGVFASGSVKVVALGTPPSFRWFGPENWTAASPVEVFCNSTHKRLTGQIISISPAAVTGIHPDGRTLWQHLPDGKVRDLPPLPFVIQRSPDSPLIVKSAFSPDTATMLVVTDTNSNLLIETWHLSGGFWREIPPVSGDEDQPLYFVPESGQGSITFGRMAFAHDITDTRNAQDLPWLQKGLAWIDNNKLVTTTANTDRLELLDPVHLRNVVFVQHKGRLHWLTLNDPSRLHPLSGKEFNESMHVVATNENERLFVLAPRAIPGGKEALPVWIGLLK
jgi:hypothetical protein